MIKFGRKKNNDEPSQNNIAVENEIKINEKPTNDKKDELKIGLNENKNEGLKLDLPEVSKQIAE